MLTGGRRLQGCRVRCVFLVLLLEFLLFSIGTASPGSSRKEIGDSLVSIENDFKTTANKVRDDLNFHSASQESEIVSTHKDSDFRFSERHVSLDSHCRQFLSRSLQRLVAEFWRATYRRLSTVLDSRPVEEMVLIGPSKEDEAADLSTITSGTGSSNPRLIRPAGHSDQTKKLSSRSLWALDLRRLQETIHLREHHRLLLGESASSPSSVPRTQVVHLGPPAPPDLLNNEKQDWNQDYAEPDVHPPSSN